MRVLHVIDSLAGSGGAEHGLVREITRFSPRIEQRVVRLYERDELEPLLADAAIDVTALGLAAATGSRTFPKAAMRLRPIVGSYRPDVIHTSLFLSNIVGQLAAWSAGVPVLSTFVLSGDLALLKATQPGGASLKAATIRRIAATSARMSHARFRALSNDARITNCRLLGVPPELVEVIPRGVPEPVGTLVPRAELGLPEDAPLIVNVARVAAQKGQVHLLRSFAALRSQRPDAHLVIVGRAGDAQRSVEDEISRFGLTGHVTMLGYTPYARHVVSHASVFAFTSLMEGLGTAVIEALVAKVPVVAFDIPPVRDVTDEGRGARLVEVGDEVGFTAALLAGLEGELASVADHGAHFATTNGNLDDISARLERLLISVASRTPVRASSGG
jgi:glycosyltransferase involved in cell wall biosynthesis